MSFHMARSKIPAHVLSLSQNLGLPVVDPDKIRVFVEFPEDLAGLFHTKEGGRDVPVVSRRYFLKRGDSLLLFSYFFQGAKPGRALGVLYVGNLPKGTWEEKL